jgi:ubiquinone/menaquinone biosynthesis C-methylase UbiE
MERLNIGHYILGIEGVALLRSWLRGEQQGRRGVGDLTRFLNDPSAGPLAVELDIPERNVVDGYGEWAETYDAVGNPLIYAEEPAVRELLDTLTPGIALDAACGTARHTAYLVSRGHKVIGVDASPAMLAKAEARVPQAEYHHGDLHELPIHTGSVDAVVCALALTHVKNLGPAIAEMARVVRRGGRVILSDQHPMVEFLGGTAFYSTAKGGFGYVTTYFHAHSSYVDAFRAAGLTIDRCLEPRWDETSINMMLAGSGIAGIADDAFRGALLGMPSALIWDLVRH